VQKQALSRALRVTGVASDVVVLAGTAVGQAVDATKEFVQDHT
jgi:hypothetical protein